MGTILGNFVHELEITNQNLLASDVDMNQYNPTNVHKGIRFQPQWNKPYVEDLAGLYPYHKNWQYFTDVIGNLTGDVNLGISALDLAPLLTPVKDYLSQRKYPKQFKYSAAKQMWKTQAPQIQQNGKYLQFPSAPANFLKNEEFKNYLGKILGPHLKVVMEVMYHCMLRAGKMRNDWMLHEMYAGKWSSVLNNFPYELSNQHFLLDIKKYIGKESVPYMPIYGRYTDQIELGHVTLKKDITS